MGSVLFIGCKREGCTDPDALNYDSKAKSDDGTCLYPDNHKFIGTYSISENCSADSVLCTGTDTYTMTIKAGGNENSITIDNLANLFNGVNATVSGNTITIPSRFGITDTWGDQWDINSGTGSINGNSLTLTTNLDDILYGWSCGDVVCSISAIK